jgi:hypothetical protein
MSRQPSRQEARRGVSATLPQPWGARRVFKASVRVFKAMASLSDLSEYRIFEGVAI